MVSSKEGGMTRYIKLDELTSPTDKTPFYSPFGMSDDTSTRRFMY